MIRVGDRGVRQRLRLVVSNVVSKVASKVASGTTTTPAKSQTGPSALSPERERRLQAAFEKLASAGNNISRLGPLIFDLISEIMPGKRLARLDLLEVQDGKTFTSPRIITSDEAYGFSGKIEITPILRQPWGEVSQRVTGATEFVASMQAISTRIEAVGQEKSSERFLALPLLGKENKVLGAMVLANKTADGISFITLEDKVTFVSFAKRVSELLDQKIITE